MKKETGIAIGAGVFLGLLFSFVVILNTQTNKSVSQKKQMDKSRPVAVNPTGTKAVIRSVEISSPSNGMIYTTSTITLKGKAEKGSLIVVQTPSKDITLTSETEAFSTPVPLTLGENIIHMSFYIKGTGAKIQEKELRVYYLPIQ